MVVDIKVALQADPRQLETMQIMRIFDTVAVGGGAGGGGAVQIVIFIEMIAGGEVETHGGSHSTHAQASEKTTPLVSTSLYFLHFNVGVCVCDCVCVWPLSVCTPQCVASTLLRVLSPLVR